MFIYNTIVHKNNIAALNLAKYVGFMTLNMPHDMGELLVRIDSVPLKES